MLNLNPNATRGVSNESALTQMSASPSSMSNDDPAGFASLLKRSQAAPSPAPVASKPPAPAPGAEASPSPAPATAPAAAPKQSSASDNAEATRRADAHAIRARQESKASSTTKSTTKPAADSAAAATSTGKADATTQAGAEDAVDAADATDSADPANALHGARKSKSRAADENVPSSSTDGVSGADAPVAGIKVDKPIASQAANTATDAATPSTASIDPNVMQWLASQQRMSAASGVAAAKAAAGANGERVETATSKDAAKTAAAKLTLDRLDKAEGGDKNTTGTLSEIGTEARVAADSKDATALGSGQRFEATLESVASGAATSAASSAASIATPEALVNGRGVDKALGESSGASAAVDNAAAASSAAASGVAASAFATALSAVRDASGAVGVGISTPVDSPDFSQALGMQMSVLARDGVQHAELHLNPADMGPVSVQITMDGTRAHVDFGADIAATRHAIEAGMPELASALRDAGFTLAGGGVSQHSRGREDGGRDSGGGNAKTFAGRGVGSTDEAQGRAAPISRRTASIGGLDLYA